VVSVVGRGPWTVIVGCLVVCVLATGSAAPGRTPVPPSESAEVLDVPVRLLQMNLCNSGLAGCYTGASVSRAAAVIRAVGPDLVTLNEVCQDDVPRLERALTDAGPGGVVVSAFQAAADRRTGGPFHCRNGRPYGIGLMARLESPLVDRITVGGTFPVQDSRDSEERAWLCLDATAFTACTTHLVNTSPGIAREQCRYLLGTAIPSVRSRGGTAATVLGGDLNLLSGGSPGVQSCLPGGGHRADDGDVQHVVTSSEFTIRSSRSIDMNGTTDHPGLLVTLTLAAPRPAPSGDRASAA
jgi:hypothetical protein